MLAVAVACAAAAGPAAAAEPYEEYISTPSRPMKPTNGALEYECIAPAPGIVPRAWFFNDTQSPFSWQSLRWSEDDEGNPTCPENTLRVARWEKRNIGGVLTYVMRGGGGTTAGAAGIRFGHVRSTELAKQTSVVTNYIPGKVGREPAECDDDPNVYVSRPERGTTSDLSSLYYKPGQPGSSGAKLDNYGNQAGGTAVPYNYVLWTPPTPEARTGGGQIRGVMPTGQNIRFCDVKPVPVKMFPAGSSSPDGTAVFQYGRIRNLNEVIHGWILHSWKRTSSPTWNYLVEGGTIPQQQSSCKAREGAGALVPLAVDNCVEVAATDNRIGVRNNLGDCFVNEGGAASAFTAVWRTTCTQVAMDGNRIGVRTSSDGCLVKEGATWATWVHEWPSSCTQVALSGNRIGVRISNGDCHVKEGGLSAVWVTQWYATCDQIAVGGAKIGVRSSSDGCLAKEGGLSASWVAQRGLDCTQIAVSNNRIGIRTAGGDCLAKDGLHGTFSVVWSVTCTQIDVTDTRIGIRTTSDGCLVKDGPTWANWVSQANPCLQVSTRASRIALRLF